MFQGLFKQLLLAGLAVLLVAVLVGPSGAAEPRAVTKQITLSAAAFQPTMDDFDFSNGGYGLWVNSGEGWFLAPLFFESRDVTVNSITLYGYDNNPGPGSDICVWLVRTTPWDGLDEGMGNVCSFGSSGSDRNFTQTGLDPRRITGTYGPYLRLHLPSSTNLTFHAVRINYSYTP